jgi:LemA protein
MKKSTIVIIVALVVVAMSLMGRYNKMVTLDEGVKTAWSQVENVYQRRLDLIPNLVATVK